LHRSTRKDHRSHDTEHQKLHQAPGAQTMTDLDS
jgi:hypothetical protein